MNSNINTYPINSNFPDFTQYGYQVTRELGHNRAGGRVTYLATEINTQRPVVVKQFQFARTGTNWTEYTAYEREIQVLRSLSHPSIPHYLDSFQTPRGFCMVQEYKNASALVLGKPWNPQLVKQIALSVLEILQYLQSQIPPVIHRDLKPENILLEATGKGANEIKVYLVDFGFARIGGGEVTVSSVVKGTLGFMPPEQLFNRQLTVASDLYSLGATLICLLTGTASPDVGRLIDDTGKMNFHKRLPQLSQSFVDWLQKMVEPHYQHRYAHAEAALEALIPLEVFRPREIPKWVLGTGAGLVGTVAVFGLFFIKFVEPVSHKMTIKPKTLENTEVTITTKPETLENITQVSIQQKRVYFRVKFFNAPVGEYAGVCQLFDGVGALVAMGEAPLQLSANESQAWCGYDFKNNEVQPGEWTFKFYLQGQLVLERSLTVIR